eukprot:CAMPEP_0197053038 /NCGR_PEP_ID=MMETSP1384-20130603/27399_1 /TAXON_ID=29189 /ORGANISM="Ammonia sp." /LENGTH=103 /DNA_ID=CAMNT_0042485875 /DNA_START=209 /DNA_END=519 /DNA_ORIENTATION=+
MTQRDNAYNISSDSNDQEQQIIVVGRDTEVYLVCNAAENRDNHDQNIHLIVPRRMTQILRAIIVVTDQPMQQDFNDENGSDGHVADKKLNGQRSADEFMIART